MAKEVKEVIIKNPQGLHARPAAMFVQIVSKYNSTVIVQKGEERINGKSIMGILTLGAQKDTKLTLEAEGDDASDVLNELVELLTKENFE
jgi:phosphocarrier protein